MGRTNTITSGGGSSGANTALSNLDNTAVNADINPEENAEINLGDETHAFKTLSLPYGAGTADDPDLYWYDPIHEVKIGFRANLSRLYACISGEDVAEFEANGGTPFLKVGAALEDVNATVGALELSGLMGISDGGTATYSNPSLALTTNPNNVPSGASRPQYFWTQSVAMTTNSTPTLIQTSVFGANSTTGFTARATARRMSGAAGSVGDSADFKIDACYKNVAGTVSLVGIVTKLANKDNAALDFNPVINGTTIEWTATGATSNTYQWNITVENQYVH